MPRTRYPKLSKCRMPIYFRNIDMDAVRPPVLSHEEEDTEQFNIASFDALMSQSSSAGNRKYEYESFPSGSTKIQESGKDSRDGGETSSSSEPESQSPCVMKERKKGIKGTIKYYIRFLNHFSECSLASLTLKQTDNMDYSEELMTFLKCEVEKVAELVVLESAKQNKSKVIEDLAQFVDFSKIPDAIGEAVMIAIDENHIPVLEVLKNAGANFTTSNIFGETALHRAARTGKTQIVEILLAGGADVDAKNKDGNTPVFEAIVVGHDDIVVRLLKARCDRY